MNTKELITEYNQKKDLQQYWFNLTKDPMFQKVLRLASLKMGPYSPSSESEIPHIQAERNGGTKGWNRLVNVLMNTPHSTDPFGKIEKEKTEEELIYEMYNR